MPYYIRLNTKQGGKAFLNPLQIALIYDRGAAGCLILFSDALTIETSESYESIIAQVDATIEMEQDHHAQH